MTNPAAELAAVADVLELIAADPQAGAARLEEMAHGLLELARQLRALPPPGGFRDPGGLSDRIRMTVTGPDGQIRQTIDTGA